jgi:hypothetical protein
MITPKEKAKELVYKYEYLVQTWDCYNDEPLGLEFKLPQMKQCALIAVDEIMEAIRFTDAKSDFGYVGYWQQVKQEIQEL